MALIKCIECGKEISDQATACPHCGYQNKKMINSNQDNDINVMDSVINFMQNDAKKSYHMQAHLRKQRLFAFILVAFMILMWWGILH